LSERFEKTYISINEFIDSWEKEIYELNQLDYFIYLIINKLGFQIEHNYLTVRNKNSYLQIDPDDIGTLAFNIGDSFESFLENNCLTNCDLQCPSKIDEKLTSRDQEYVDKNLHIVHIINEENWNRRQFLVTDILNYVVLDTLYDFYNYDIGINVEESDIGLLKFADFITDILVKFIYSNGQIYLENAREPATNLFDKLVVEEDTEWKEDNNSEITDMDGEVENGEIWKLGNNSIQNLTEEFLTKSDIEKMNPDFAEKSLEYLHNYINNYSGFSNIEEFNKEDLEEFISFWLIRELTLDTHIEINDVLEIYLRFFSWLEYSKNIAITNIYTNLIKHYLFELNYVLNAARTYLQNYSVVNGILEANTSEMDLIDGYFEITSINKEGFLRLQDIHLKKNYYNVIIDKRFAELFEKGFIFEATLKPTGYGWRLLNLEYIFPKIAKPYLH
jgi:hypothetical protein